MSNWRVARWLPLLWLPDDNNDRLAIINRQTFRNSEAASLASASTISQKWEQDARKDPEEEYFRLVSVIRLHRF